MAEAIKIFNKSGELVRTYTENESDERSDYKEKAKEFSDKNGYSLGKAPKVEETVESSNEVAQPLGVSEVAKPKGKPKGKK